MASLRKTRCICLLANKSILNERNLSQLEFLVAIELDREGCIFQIKYFTPRCSVLQRDRKF